jgi:hypothetical protein
VFFQNTIQKYFLINSTEIRTESVKEIHFGDILQKEDKKARKNAFFHLNLEEKKKYGPENDKRGVFSGNKCIERLNEMGICIKRKRITRTESNGVLS